MVGRAKLGKKRRHFVSHANPSKDEQKGLVQMGACRVYNLILVKGKRSSLQNFTTSSIFYFSFSQPHTCQYSWAEAITLERMDATKWNRERVSILSRAEVVEVGEDEQVGMGQRRCGETLSLHLSLNSWRCCISEKLWTIKGIIIRENWKVFHSSFSVRGM